MFILKKLLTPLIIPPGLFVMLLLFSGVVLWRRNLRRYASFNIAVALLIWVVSIVPVSRALIGSLESGLSIPTPVQGDVVILLGGGIYEGVPDLTGSGSPSEDMCPRLVTAARLYRRLHVPIIISGGSVYAGRAPEAPVIRRFLVDLGVAEEQMILEAKSRDTRENALYCSEIVRQRGFRRPVLVTSAYHMRRSIQAFKKEGVMVTPLPAQFVTGKALPLLWADCLPSANALLHSSSALREYAGLLVYRVASLFD
ncbi:MAG: YdcF family protein [Desulfuromonadales bacterium]|nr:YdcF family protein [Desulfuromonadales bacterium]